jgi:transposase
MKYTPEERLEIGRRIYEGEINVYKAAVEYGIGETCARNYMRRYRSANNLPAKGHGTPIIRKETEGKPKPVVLDPGLEEYESMTKEELIKELVRARIREERLKKGYEVKGAGAEKVYILLNSKNTK